MLDEAKAASERFAAEENIEVAWSKIWSIEPILFDETLVGLAEEAIKEVAGTWHRLPSGPLHDAAEVSRAGIPTVMVFVQSLRGLSHTKLEDTKPEHLELSVQALDRLATKALAAAVRAVNAKPERLLRLLSGSAGRLSQTAAGSDATATPSTSKHRASLAATGRRGAAPVKEHARGGRRFHPRG